MTPEKSIVIGCDDAINLSVILNAIKGSALLSQNIITATRTSDLMGIVKSLNPDLVILCFRNNQSVLDNFNSFVKKPELPLLCLTRSFDNEALYWLQDNIVFTYPLESIRNTGYLTSRINSIFLLRSTGLKENESASFAKTALRGDQSENTRNMSRYILELDQKIEALLKVKDRIAELYPRVGDPVRAELMSIVNAIKVSAGDNKLWEDFKLYFEQTSPDFLFTLSKKYPFLTPVDLKYCCYLKMNMSNDDIRNLLGINQESVRTHKYRLKKKMSLPKDQDLRSYLRSVYQ